MVAEEVAVVDSLPPTDLPIPESVAHTDTQSSLGSLMSNKSNTASTASTTNTASTASTGNTSLHNADLEQSLSMVTENNTSLHNLPT